MIPKKTTKMIVKDGSGNLVQLLPEIEAASTIDASSDVPVSNAALASALEDIEDSLPASALLDVMEEEPTALNTTELDDEALIVWMEPPMPSWSITINTELAGTGEKTGQIPFSFLYSFNYESSDYSDTIQNALIVVDWGDGNTITYTNATSSNVEYITYEYSSLGIYTITISSNCFDKMYILQGNGDWLWGYNDQIYSTILTSINSPLPNLAGSYGWCWDSEYDISCQDNDFYGCFAYCSSLASIPQNLFNNNTEAIGFDDCFRNCSSLQSIPSGLFDECTSAIAFGYCFEYCNSLASIPTGLFENNTLVTRFHGCFYSCTSLNDFTLHIGATNVAQLWDFVSKKTGTTRTIYVPSGSTTQTTFNSIASSYGLTIIGE